MIVNAPLNHLDHAAANSLNHAADSLNRAAAVIKAGGLVAFPTETVYGLGADAFNTEALAQVFALKKRPFFDPLIVHIAEIAALERIACLSGLSPNARDTVRRLTGRFWPGPLTLVLPKQPALPALATGGLDTVAVRFPSNALAQELIRRSTGAIAAPSANPFGSLSPTRAEHVEEHFPGILILDGGKTALGLESTVLDIPWMDRPRAAGSPSLPRILRQGGVPAESIAEIFAEKSAEISADFSAEFSPRAARNQREGEGGAKPIAPGLLKSHYAPRARLTLYANGGLRKLPWDKNAAYLFFEEAALESFARRHGLTAAESASESASESAPGGGGGGKNRLFALSKTGGSAEAAANLFDTLHAIDRLRPAAIYAEEAPPAGLGAAINDRLFKAGGSRPVLNP